MKIILITNKAGEIRHYADSSLQRNGQAWFEPEYGKDWTALICPIIKITRLGTHISERFASRYYESVGVAALFFPGENMISPEVAAEEIFVRDAALCIGEAVTVGGQDTQHCIEVGDMMLKFEVSSLEINKMISKVSGYTTLKMGDMLIFGSNRLYISLSEGYHLTATIDGMPSISLKIK